MLLRFFRHLLWPLWRLRGKFPPEALRDLESRLAASERKHRGQIRFVIESGWAWRDLGKTVRERAKELFALEGVWDTRERCGILFYISFADRALEIVADRGIAAVTPVDTWEKICRVAAEDFRRDAYTDGLSAALQSLDEVLLRHFPEIAGSPDENELPDQVLLR